MRDSMGLPINLENQPHRNPGRHQAAGDFQYFGFRLEGQVEAQQHAQEQQPDEWPDQRLQNAPSRFPARPGRAPVHNVRMHAPADQPGAQAERRRQHKLNQAQLPNNTNDTRRSQRQHPLQSVLQDYVKSFHGVGRVRALSWREDGSPGRTRTSDQLVNSQPLYLLSYRGSAAEF